MSGLHTLHKAFLQIQILLLCLLLLSSTASAGDKRTSAQPDLSEIARELSDPMSKIWALYTEFDFSYSKGDLSDGEYKSGGAMLFQPKLPLQLNNDWRLILRPTVPFPLGAPVPETISGDGTAEFGYKSGLGDIDFPLMFSPIQKGKHSYVFGFGPTFQFPTATSDELGTATWEAGPAFGNAYKTEKFVLGALGQYWFSFAKTDNSRPDTSHGAINYFIFYKLPDSWEIGMNPTITYNHKADSGNRWNVPMGLMASKTLRLGKLPIKIQFGVEKSIVGQDSFGDDWRIKLNLIPVIPTLVSKSIF